jgi:hypothetical protein
MRFWHSGLWRNGPHRFCAVVRLCGCLVCVTCVFTALSADEPVVVPLVPADPLLRVTIREGEQTRIAEGRSLVDAQDGGILLEERNGRLRLLSPDVIASRFEQPESFRRMSGEEVATDLLTQVPAGFEAIETPHYVLCFSSAEEYAEFCGKLLEKVFDEYFQFMKTHEIHVVAPVGKLPVIVFLSESDFRKYAEAQHPETSFADTPGYYSIRENQMLLLDLTRDRSVRSAKTIRKLMAQQPLQVATVVHEAVHQLAFNSGLQVRMADNPVWLSEGLAVYFEPLSPRTSLLWKEPGIVNGRHHPEFMRVTAQGAPQIPFVQLIGSDRSFRDSQSVAAAYAESWALTTYLFRQKKSEMRQYLSELARRKPLKAVTEAQRLSEFRAAFGGSPDELEQEVVSYVQRLKVPK